MAEVTVQEFSSRLEDIYGSQTTIDTATGRRQLEASDWGKVFWDQGQVPWHEAEENRFLMSYCDQLCNKKGSLTVFVPLCGKTKDMRWLLSKGHRVIGVEFCEVAITEFQEEQGIVMTSRELPDIDGTVHESEDGKLTIYCCDIFKASSAIIGKVDAIFDRGALEAINVSDRQKYASLMADLCTSGATMLASVQEYNLEQYQGPPHAVFMDDMKKHFGECFSIQCMEREDQDKAVKEHFGVDSLERVCYLLTRH